MLIVPFKQEHLDALALQESQAWVRSMFPSKEYRVAIQKAGPCFTGIHDGKVLCCAGLAHVWEGRAQAWALMSCFAGMNFIGIFRGIKRFLDMQHYRRLEAVVDVGFEPGHRLMKMLGFKAEGVLSAYLPNGADCMMYGRVL